VLENKAPNRRPIIAIDFDETIARSDPNDNYRIVGLVKYAKLYIPMLAQIADIIIWTC
jgi:hypothetical protein